MKKLILLFTLCFIAMTSQAQNSPYLVKSFNASDIKNLDIRTSGGGIEVTGSDASQAVVEVYIKGNGGNRNLSDSEIAERLEDFTLTVEKNGNTLVAIAKSNRNNNWKRGLSITFKIKSPVNVDTEIMTSGGGIHLTNLEGNLNFNTSGGGLHLANLGGDIKGRTSGGGIHAKDCRDNINLHTSGGGIDVTDSEGEMDLHTSGGGIKLAHLTGKINAHTSGGGIRVNGIRGELITGTSGGSIRLADISGSLKANTSGGGITAEIKELGEFLTLHTSGGSIQVDMPMNKGMDLDIRGDRVSMDFHNFNGRSEKNHIRGTINGGGIEVNISANSGHVTIN